MLTSEAVFSIHPTASRATKLNPEPYCFPMFLLSKILYEYILMKPPAPGRYTKLNYGTCLTITNTGIQHGISTELYASCKLTTVWSHTSASPFFLHDLCRENFVFFYHSITSFWYDVIYLLTAIGLTPSGSSTIHIYTQTVHRTTQKQNTQNSTYIHSFSILSDDRSKASSETIPPHSAI
jgi:hypothetical protein